MELQRARRHIAWFRHPADGQALVIFAIFGLVLIGALALAVDAGFFMAERRQVQSAADAGAMAAARALYDSKFNEVESTGVSYATYNAGGGSSATVERPPSSGDHAGDNNYVEVTVTKSVTKYFLGAVYAGNWQVTARAVAGIEREPGNYALLTLERSVEPGIYLNGNTTIKITGDNGSAMSNTNILGSNNTDFDVAGTIDAHTTIQSGGGWSAPGGMHTGMPFVDDPMTGVSAPAATTVLSPPDCSNNCSWVAGTYRNGSVTCRRTCTFGPGLYVFQNFDLSMQNTNSRVQGSGVMWYFDSASSFDPKNGEIRLTAPSSSPYAGGKTGVVLWYASCALIDSQGNGELYLQGIVYAPCAHIALHGNPYGTALNGQLIADTFEVKGTSDFLVSYHNYVDIQRPKVFLVE